MAIDPDDVGFAPPPPKTTRSVTGLLSDLAAETTQLIRQELELLKEELSEKAGRAAQGAGAIGAGALIAYSGWFFLLLAAVLGLATVLPGWLAALIVGVVVVAIGAVLTLLGKRRLAAGSLVPQRSLRSLREDEAWLLERLR